MLMPSLLLAPLPPHGSCTLLLATSALLLLLLLLLLLPPLPIVGPDAMPPAASMLHVCSAQPTTEAEFIARWGVGPHKQLAA